MAGAASAASAAPLPHTVADCWDAAGAPNALGYDAQLSLLQWRLKKSSGLAKHRANAQSLLQQCRAGASLVALAEANDVAPASLARVVVEAHLGAQKSKVSKYLREPHRTFELAEYAAAHFRRTDARARTCVPDFSHEVGPPQSVGVRLRAHDPVLSSPG